MVANVADVERVGLIHFLGHFERGGYDGPDDGKERKPLLAVEYDGKGHSTSNDDLLVYLLSRACRAEGRPLAHDWNVCTVSAVTSTPIEAARLCVTCNDCRAASMEFVREAAKPSGPYQRGTGTWADGLRPAWGRQTQF